MAQIFYYVLNILLYFLIFITWLLCTLCIHIFWAFSGLLGMEPFNHPIEYLKFLIKNALLLLIVSGFNTMLLFKVLIISALIPMVFYILIIIYSLLMLDFIKYFFLLFYLY